MQGQYDVKHASPTCEKINSLITVFSEMKFNDIERNKKTCFTS